MGKLTDWLTGADLEVRAEARSVAVTDSLSLGGPFGYHDAIENPTTYRCVDLLSTDVASLPVREFNRSTQEITAAEDTPRVLRRPDPSIPARRFLVDTIVDMLADGFGLWEKTAVDDFGRAIALRRIPANLVAVSWDQALGQTRAQLTGARTYTLNGGTRIDPTTVVHIPMLMFPGEPTGVGPVQAAWKILAGAAAADSMVRSTFTDGVFPSGVVEVPTGMSQAHAEQLGDRFENRNRGSRRPVVMTGGAAYKNLTTTMRDQQWTETRQLNAAELARFFGVPGGMLGIPVQGGSGSIQYSNDVSQRTSLLHLGMAPIMWRLEVGLSEAALPSTREAFFDARRFLSDLPLDADDSTFGQPGGNERDRPTRRDDPADGRSQFEPERGNTAVQ